MAEMQYFLTSEDANWTKIGLQLALCAIVQVVLAVVAIPVRHIVLRSQAKNGALDRFFQANVGFGYTKPKNNEFVATLFLLQMCASFTITVLWIFKTYSREVTTPVFVVELVCSAVVVLHYAVNLCKFSGNNVWSFDALLDVFTIIPLLVQTSAIKTWISWSFLRSIRAFKAYARLEGSGALDDVSDFSRAILLAVFKFIALLISFAGVMFVVEVLGDFDSFYDIFIETAMGSVSFYQMVYFVMVTVSTVGYGDYSPVTVLGRLFIIVFIVAGVAFFSIETGNLMTILALTNSGKGRYHPRKKKGRHVVVAGGAVSQPSGQVIINFLREICHESREDCPEVVLLALRPPSAELRSQINESPRLKDHVKYICGSPLLKEDLVRVRANRATMLYVLGDMSAENPDKEDEENIMRGSMLHKLLPEINLRLMLLRPENRKVAADIGLPVFMCFSVNEIKSNMLAMGCRCQGFGTLVLNLMKMDNNTVIEAKAKVERIPIPAWQEAFMDGSSNEIYGFCLNSRFSGKTFQQAAAECFRDCNVTLFATQVRDTGVILLAPGAYEMGKDDICFAIAKDVKQLDPIKHDEIEWVPLFKQRRRSANAAKVQASASMKRSDLMSGFEMSPEIEAAEMERTLKNSAALGDKSSKNIGGATAGGDVGGGAAGRKMIFPGGLMRLGNDGHQDVGGEAGKSKNARPSAGEQTFSLEEDADVEMTDADAKEHQLMLHDIIDEGGHILLVGQSKGLWQQIFSIIRALRKPWLNKQRNIVCITSEKAPLKLRSIFPEVCFVNGVAQKLPTLLHAGANTAHDIIVLSGAPTTQEALLLDRRAILLSAIIDSQKRKWGFEIRKVLELHSPSSCNQLMNYSVKKAPEARLSFMGGGKQPKAVDFGEDVLPEVHPLFAGGEAMFRGDFVQLWASSFYTPGILEIAESLLGAGSASAQVSYPWLVDVPGDFFGGTYKDLFDAICAEGAVPLGLLRPRMTEGAPKQFVHTCPPLDLKLVGGDQVYMLAPSECPFITSDTQ